MQPILLAIAAAWLFGVTTAIAKALRLSAWFVFKEHAGRRVVVGMMFVSAGGIVLSGVAGGTGLAGSGAG
jgi:hypothetical protein